MTYVTCGEAKATREDWRPHESMCLPSGEKVCVRSIYPQKHLLPGRVASLLFPSMAAWPFANCLIAHQHSSNEHGCVTPGILGKDCARVKRLHMRIWQHKLCTDTKQRGFLNELVSSALVNDILTRHCYLQRITFSYIETLDFIELQARGRIKIHFKSMRGIAALSKRLIGRYPQSFLNRMNFYVLIKSNWFQL